MITEIEKKIKFGLILISCSISFLMISIIFIIIVDIFERENMNDLCKEYGGTMTKNKPAHCLYYGELYKFINTYDGWKIPSLEKYVLMGNNK